MLLVQKDKAGEYALSQYFQGKLLKIRQQRSKINQRIKVHTTLSVEDQMTYYSTWYYAAIHILVSVPGYQTVDAIASRLKLNARTVTSALSFLVVRGFVLEDQNTFSIGKTRMHLDKTNRMLPRHHSNWRMRALDSVDNDKVDDLHYTSVLGISKKDMKRFKEELLNLLEKFEPVIQESIQDTQVIFLLDLFET
jgi:predicted transcriptional regulator